jgi:hypothetical protein
MFTVVGIVLFLLVESEAEERAWQLASYQGWFLVAGAPEKPGEAAN